MEDPDSPDFRIVVGPTIHYPLPHKVLQDRRCSLPGEAGAGRRWGLQRRRLCRRSACPSSRVPQAGEQVLYNMYYVYQPWVLIDDYDEVLVDTHYNKFKQQTLEIQYRLAHVSEPNLPVVNPRSTGYYTSIFDESSRSRAGRRNYSSPWTILINSRSTCSSLAQAMNPPFLAARCSPIIGFRLRGG